MLNWTIDGETCTTTLENGVLTYLADRHAADPDASITTARGVLLAILFGVPFEELVASGALQIDGDSSRLGDLVALLDAPDPGFDIVTP